MRIRPDLCLAIAVSLLAISGPAAGQEGYPLDGTWRGQWGDASTGPNRVVIVMKWDGDNINGTINPGPNSIPFTAAVLDPAVWRVHFEAMTHEGEPVEIDGTLEDIGSYNRSIEGTWTQAGTHYEFKITRE